MVRDHQQAGEPSGPSPGSDISIGLASWNTCGLLDHCLQSIYDTAGDMDIEVIVVDNASSDGSPEMVADKYPQVRLIRNRVNMGFAAASNIAFKHSQGRHFVLLNTDTVVLDGAFQAMMAFMDSHTDAGIVGCKLLNGDGSLQRSCSAFPSPLTELWDSLYLSKLFPKSRIFASYSMTYWDFNQTREVDFAGGSCLMVRREAIEEVGLLDEDYFMYTEEADWCYRMWQHDWKVYYYPEAKIIHLGGRSSRKYGSDLLLQLYVSRNRFIGKHSGPLMARAHRWIVGIGAIIRIVFLRMKPSADPGQPDAVAFHRKLLRWALDGNPDVGISRTREAAA